MGQENSKSNNTLDPNGFQKPMEKNIKDQILSLPQYTLEQVAQHNQPTDAWIIINGLVFDITQYQHAHPGGSKIIFAKAGQDGSDDFEALKHSQRAKEKLKTLCVGRLAK
ncbi:cytochrome b5-like heme/steroid-binding domain protein (macronuclear) [Tetrahymena thermophila SB210]|uniref:Cytochrome b5-like heme/steroid-binding domain protein n=1 Tax=Tetrahymena thermophila (strain SB210) TaxID=312017 RepID=Q23D01_TETTS|nr:cytochrome b5-like heme/steroid-binding domain protein [Tetrahymena thermophila SB210]EAR94723.1 cytochrome b5-like heme/steroid-binding domain protein [Tetrahymena thermophila SB210]|eukprot:XP_001014885.1 cytochrome b5-like heme/steroid-binding domain protein [Tetrahymena thermophila SB210]